MKTLLTVFFSLIMSALYSQLTPAQPIEETHPVNNLWRIAGVVIVVAIGIAAYMLIKRNPKKDAY